MKYQRLRRELLEAERRAVVELRNTGEIRDEVMRRIERDLDLEDSRLDVSRTSRPLPRTTSQVPPYSSAFWHITCPGLRSPTKK